MLFSYREPQCPGRWYRQELLSCEVRWNPSRRNLPLQGCRYHRHAAIRLALPEYRRTLHPDAAPVAIVRLTSDQTLPETSPCAYVFYHKPESDKSRVGACRHDWDGDSCDRPHRHAPPDISECCL